MYKTVEIPSNLKFDEYQLNKIFALSQNYDITEVILDEQQNYIISFDEKISSSREHGDLVIIPNVLKFNRQKRYLKYSISEDINLCDFSNEIEILYKSIPNMNKFMEDNNIKNIKIYFDIKYNTDYVSFNKKIKIINYYKDILNSENKKYFWWVVYLYILKKFYLGEYFINNFISIDTDLIPHINRFLNAKYDLINILKTPSLQDQVFAFVETHKPARTNEDFQEINFLNHTIMRIKIINSVYLNNISLRSLEILLRLTKNHSPVINNLKME